jgi:hypothetical protein
VGTGGPEGGPTGLFTVYDGSTLRRGEFTFSIAYSNYDRDPGNVDITDVPLSFNVGINDHIEVFFKTTGWRGIKVNNPANLSSFYLPNSQLFCGTVLCSPPAIVLAPNGLNISALAGTAFFRPLNNQPFVQYPFVGGSAGTFGLSPTGPFGVVGVNPVLGPPLASANSGTFSGADVFPGIGSPVGGLLPGIVLSTAIAPGTVFTLPRTIPANFTVAPAYLPDAPFVNRLFGESAVTNLVFGAKIRFTGPRNPLGVGIIPFYRWWLDKGNDLSGFNQMQRGAGPGGDIGDFGLIGFVDGRLGKHANLSANFGYILNSNPKGLGDFVLLDRPDELLAGVGFDFPINKFFQPVAEVRSTQYVGGRTPNAFENNPVEVLGGVKIYPRRWFGFGAAYRRHLNSQDSSHFNDASGTTNIVLASTGATATTSATTGGSPSGFRFSDDPNGFIGQFWIGRRNARALPAPPNAAPSVTSVTASVASLMLPCETGDSVDSCTPATTREVQLNAVATDPDNDTLLYSWSVTSGRITGEGRQVTWDLSGLNPGTYTATVTVNDGNQHTATGTTTVTVGRCECKPPPCPTISVSCPSDVEQGAPITFTASVVGGTGSPTYNWSVSAGTITSGQGTSTITVDTAGIGGQTVTATVDIGGLDPACARTASCSTGVKPPPPEPIKFDEYGNIRFNDEKARLDNFAIQLQNRPDAQGYYIVYGTCAGEGQARADRAKNYLVNNRGIEASRIVVVDGGCRADFAVQLWIVPSGAQAPAASTDGVISPCPECRRRVPRRRRR